ncbi:MAG: TerB family tellurite resistance protein [Leptospiraceae bacterium]|nr:TerB family tellurite resistance protein [Leptospiraceae bacterium]MCP5499002.1 TerB family tellurite resistance protein [Leptospiraceae bacterium]
MNLHGFFSLWLAFLLIWWGFAKIEASSRTRRPSLKRGNNSSEDYFQNTRSSLISKLKREFAMRTPTEVLSGVIASVSIHIAKSDGRISEEEIDAIKFALKTRFGQVEQKFIRDIVLLTREHIEEIGEDSIFPSIVEVINLYLRLVDSLDTINRETLYLLIFGVIYEVSIADGQIRYKEEILFQRICSYFRIPRDYQAQIKRSAHYAYNVRKNRGFGYEDSSYQTSEPSGQKEAIRFKESIDFFNLNANYSSEELEKAWKKIIMMYHPDRHHNAKPEIYELMNQKFLESKQVYEYLKSYLNKPRPQFNN